MLTDHGASQILIENGPDKKPSSISFRIQTAEYGLFSFRIPARLAQIEKILAANILAPNESKPMNRRP